MESSVTRTKLCGGTLNMLGDALYLDSACITCTCGEDIIFYLEKLTTTRYEWQMSHHGEDVYMNEHELSEMRTFGLLGELLELTGCVVYGINKDCGKGST